MNLKRHSHEAHSWCSQEIHSNARYLHFQHFAPICMSMVGFRVGHVHLGARFFESCNVNWKDFFVKVYCSPFLCHFNDHLASKHVLRLA